MSCDSSMSRKGDLNKCPSMDWWNDHINIFRKDRENITTGLETKRQSELIEVYKRAAKPQTNEITMKVERDV